MKRWGFFSIIISVMLMLGLQVQAQTRGVGEAQDIANEAAIDGYGRGHTKKAAE